jgi:diguanylate cyclase (GGDEF)-like protein
MARRQDLPISALFIDVDHFKAVNDQLGHDAGDALLVHIAKVVRIHLRASDLAGRLGGDEFALILPGSDATAANEYAEKLRLRLNETVHKKHPEISFSIGVASFAKAPGDFSSLLREADVLMYAAKNAGGNRLAS